MLLKTPVTSDPTLRPAPASERCGWRSPVLGSSWPRDAKRWNGKAPESGTHNAGTEFFEALCNCGENGPSNHLPLLLTNWRHPRQTLSRTFGDSHVLLFLLIRRDAHPRYGSIDLLIFKFCATQLPLYRWVLLTFYSTHHAGGYSSDAHREVGVNQSVDRPCMDGLPT